MQTRNLIASLTLGISLAAIPVLQSHAQVEQTPNLYNFTGYNSKGEKVSINYSTSSFIGKPLFKILHTKSVGFPCHIISAIEVEDVSGSEGGNDSVRLVS